jgi:hypothetical protein
MRRGDGGNKKKKEKKKTAGCQLPVLAALCTWKMAIVVE